MLLQFVFFVLSTVHEIGWFHSTVDVETDVYQKHLHNPIAFP